MVTIFIRTILVYFFVVLTFRMLGKRQIGELEPSELVVAIIISEVAAQPIQDTSQPLINSLIAIFLLVILEVCVSYSAYKSFGVRKVLFGTPSVFYEKGKINQKEMEKQRFNLNDLMECVRNTGAASLSEVDFIIMETNGNVSVIPTAQSRPINTGDMNIKAQPTRLSYVIIDNGCINYNNLNRIGMSEKQLQKRLRPFGVDAEDVFCMTATKNGEVVVIPKER